MPCNWLILPLIGSIGGSIIALSGERLGTFTLGANSCGDGTEGHFNFLQHPNEGGLRAQERIRFNGIIDDAKTCVNVGTFNGVIDSDCEACTNSVLFGLSSPFSVVTGEYTSNSQSSQGETGRLIACFRDNGEGMFAMPDMAYVDVQSGPFEGLVLEGTIQGNSQTSECQ